MKKRGVLVPAHFAANTRLLENVHRLPDLRLSQAQAARHRIEGSTVREIDKHRIQIMQSVADFVDGQHFGLLEAAVGCKGLFLKKAAHFVGGVQKIPVNAANLLIGGEYSLAGEWVKAFHDLQGACAQGRHSRRGLEVGQYKVAVLLKALQWV